MSESDSRQTSGTNVTAPVVLAINCASAQKYLSESNEVLSALYGEAPIRLNVNDREFPWELFFPSDERYRLELLEYFPTVSVSKLAEFVQSSKYIDALATAIFNAVIIEGGDTPGLAWQWQDDVKVILINEGCCSDHESPLGRLAKAYFPNAQLFEVRGDYAVPQRVQLTS